MTAAAEVKGAIHMTLEAGVCRIVIANPPLNVLGTTLLNVLADVITEACRDPRVRVLTLRGEGPRAFCAGVDVADHTLDRVGGMMHAFARAVSAILGAQVPVVAVLNGAALGGGFELALTCDIVLARNGIMIGQPEIRLGVFPPVAAVLLPRLIGRQAALDLILTGRTIHAEDARALGLVAATWPSEVFDAEVEDYIRLMAEQSAPVMKLAKRAVDAAAGVPLARALREADRCYLDELMSLHDPKEGLAAFMEKRGPVWRHA